MQLGYFTMPLHPVGRDWRQTLAECRDALVHTQNRKVLPASGVLL